VRPPRLMPALRRRGPACAARGLRGEGRSDPPG
jgi:hypothetical protein